MILLFSGGLDSYIAWHFLHKPKTLYCDLGHRYGVHEIETIKRLVPETTIDSRLNLADWEQKDAYIPNRNALLVIIASQYDSDVVLVVQKGEMDIPDRSPKFFNSFGEWLTFLNQGSVVTISTPFIDMTKTDMVRWYLNRNLDPDILISTRSCYSASEKPCGNCSACFRRWVAFTNNDLEEEYEQPIKNFDGIKIYLDKLRRGLYEKQRASETLMALKKEGII